MSNINNDLCSLVRTLKDYVDKGALDSSAVDMEEPERISYFPQLQKPLNYLKSFKGKFVAVDCSTKPLMRGNRFGVYLLRQTADNLVHFPPEQLVNLSQIQATSRDFAQKPLPHRVGDGGNLHRAASGLDQVEFINSPDDDVIHIERVENLDAGCFLCHGGNIVIAYHKNDRAVLREPLDAAGKLGQKLRPLRKLHQQPSLINQDNRVAGHMPTLLAHLGPEELGDEKEANGL